VRGLGTLDSNFRGSETAFPAFSLKAKSHYAILVAERSEAGRRPVADLLAR